MKSERHKETRTPDVITARHVATETGRLDLGSGLWREAQSVAVTRYWSGEDAPAERHMEARLAWSAEALFVRFDCRQFEPLVVSPEPQTLSKTVGLWERDVCEIFVAPDESQPERYFEFEAAPTGEWLDLGIRQLPGARETDWEFHSGMTAAARIGRDSVTIAMRVPWEGLGRAPRAGQSWRVNLFRCIGSGDGRGYLAWQPTRTERPNFHLPAAFGRLRFEG